MEPNQTPTQLPEPLQPPPHPTPEVFNSQSSNAPTTPDKTNGFAIAGIILAFLLPLIGLIFSIIGLAKAKNYNGNGKGLSIAGIVISAIFTLISLLIIPALILTTMSSIQRKANEAEKKSNSVSQSQTSNLELGDVYKEKSGAYSIKLPKGWKTDQFEASRNLTVIAPSSSGDYVSTISVSVDKTYPGETLADFVASETETTTKYEGGTIQSQKAVTINGVSGHEITAHKDTGGTVSESYTVILVKGESVYRLDFRTSPERNNAYLPVFKESAQSFTVT